MSALVCFGESVSRISQASGTPPLPECMSNQPGLWDAPAPVPTPEPDLVPLDAYGATPDHVEVPADYIPVD